MNYSIYINHTVYERSLIIHNIEMNSVEVDLYMDISQLHFLYLSIYIHSLSSSLVPQAPLLGRILLINCIASFHHGGWTTQFPAEHCQWVDLMASYLNDCAVPPEFLFVANILDHLLQSLYLFGNITPWYWFINWLSIFIHWWDSEALLCIYHICA